MAATLTAIEQMSAYAAKATQLDPIECELIRRDLDMDSAAKPKAFRRVG